ncbi:MAG: UPF0179 family protein [Halobacteriota archaeon]
MEEGRVVTLIGAKQAKEGEEFIFCGAATKCDECRLKKSCANLEVGRRYRIEKVREEIKHDCFVHEDGVRVIEVTEPPIELAIDARHAMKGFKVVFEPVDCEKTPELFELCNPEGLKEGDRCTILNVIGDVPGEGDKKGLKLVEIKREAR